jgi:hypothetical protein
MRARKAERCLERASSAIENGALGEAEAALAEARELDPGHARVQELSDRLDELKQPLPESPTLRLNWTGVAAAFGLVLVSVGGLEMWRYREEIWTDKGQSISTPQTDVDESSGLAAPGSAAVPAAVSIASSPPASDAVVNTQIVQPETIAETPFTPPESALPPNRPATTTPTVTATTGERVETTTNAVAQNPSAPVNPPRPSEAAAPPPTREVAAPSLDYTTPSTLPATGSPSASGFIPSVVPPATDTTNASTPAASGTMPDPAPAAPAPTPAAPSPAPSPNRDQSTAIRAALGRYETAYNRLDVAAVQSVWPSIDQRALARAFDSLTSQHVSLQNCTIDVIGVTARANCSGTASWTPRIGGGERRAARKWTFNLNQADGAWRIVQVQAR